MKITTDIGEYTIFRVADYAAAEGLTYDQAYEKLLNLAITFNERDEGSRRRQVKTAAVQS